MRATRVGRWVCVGIVCGSGCAGSQDGQVTPTVAPEHAPEVAIVSPEEGAVLYPGDAPWTFTGTVSDAGGSDPALLAVTWVLERGLVVQAEQTAIPDPDGTVRFDMTYLQEDTYALSLTASDTVGLSTTVAVSFEVRNQPPEVVIIEPVPGATVFQWQPLTLAARITDRESQPGQAFVVTLSDSQTGEQATGTSEADGTVSFEYVPYREGPLQLAVTALDELSARGVATVDVVVQACDDSDQDGFLTCATVEGAADCDDDDPGAYPGAEERCNGKDDDCDGKVPVEEYDMDNDGQSSCEGDCADDDMLTSGNAHEVCDGKDNDCDGVIPEAELDQDGDGYRACGTSSAAPDCDDLEWAVHPGAVEACNGRDDDCDGELALEESDIDGDGWMTCGGDCDDADCNTYPGAVERLDFADNDCDGRVEGAVTTDAAAMVYTGVQADAQAGYSLASGGDIDGDGAGDLVIGAPRYVAAGSSGTYEGAVFVALGSTGAWCGGGEMSLEQVPVLSGDETGARAGTAVSIAGDINGDGLDDLLVGAPYHDSALSGAGAVYLVAGRADWADGSLSEAALTVVEGSSSGMYLGAALSGPGDIDGNGVLDVAIGAPWNERRPYATGMVALLSARPFAWPNRVSVATLPRVVGTGDVAAGVSVALGRSTPDGKSDLLVGGLGDPATTPGLVYWLPGTEAIRQGQQQALEDLDARRYDAAANGVEVGWAVASGADIDGDGLEDALVGVGESTGQTTAAAYLLFGAGSLPASGTLEEVAGVRFTRAEEDHCPCSVALLEDWNGDGLGDLAVGVALASQAGTSTGRVYLFLGRDGREAWPREVELAAADGVIEGAAAGEQAGFSLCAGDLNGDGRTDLVAGSPFATVTGPDGTVLYRAGKIAVFLGPGGAAGGV